MPLPTYKVFKKSAPTYVAKVKTQIAISGKTGAKQGMVRVTADSSEPDRIVGLAGKSKLASHLHYSTSKPAIETALTSSPIRPPIPDPAA